MTVVLRHNEELEVNRVEFGGSVMLAELRAMAGFFAAHPAWLTFDCLNLVRADAHFDAVERAEIDALFAIYRAGFEQMQRLIVRRSAWLCLSPRAQPTVEHWVGGRAARSPTPIDIKLFTAFDEAARWLVLSAEEIEDLKTGGGFVEIVRFAAAPASSLAPR